MNITIVGLGNIGGSFAMSLKENAAEHDVYAIDVDSNALRNAEQDGIIIKGYTEPEEILPKTDLIIFAVYPLIMKSLVEKYGPYLKDDAVLTDVTGVKRSIIGQIEPILPEHADFIFGHPMAGRENRGLKYASGEVFKGANYLFTLTDRNKESNVRMLSSLVERMGFKNISAVSPEFHDDVIGFTSQLTHVIALSLINSDDVERRTKQYTGDSYRDLTRITNINENLWPELFIMNKDYLLNHIDRFKSQMDLLKDAIEAEDIDTMKEMMVEARRRYHDLHDLELPESNE
ncbi:prephenate dehydrogenase [Salinicoccus sp. ID82-1]|uniref:prephenate dehydrogenase n=1 Tax=Salinicoccus sp. ID82-1 TaxID=2820269 RepID=UPI001F446FC5|nr:prephenate dehydrogenase [Salinicoccus sp. ID82-1]MCG1010475.1 prephenate dehydrogenase [Salinicoccus sp. ID82-1]